MSRFTRVLSVIGVAALLAAVLPMNTASAGPLNPPSVPLHVQTWDPTLNSIDVTWEAPASDGGSPITDYTIEYRKVGTTAWSNFVHVPSDNTSVTVTGLDQASTYAFRIAAVNVNGSSEWTQQVTAFAVGLEHTCALVSDGSALCWGRNSFGRLGNGSTTNVNVPTPVTGIDGSTPATTAVALASGEVSSCALLADGAVNCWGRNNSGQLGDGTNTNSTTPVAVSGFDGLTPATSAVSISTFGTHVCALRADGSVACWGGNMDGQLGDGTRIDSNIPVAVTGLDGSSAGKTAVSITTGSYNSCVVLATAAVKCWGGNTFGQLGDGTLTIRLTPTRVSGLTGTPGVVQVSAGRASTCVVFRDGSAKCWGDNADGRLGDGGNTRQLTPVAVSGLDGSTPATTVRSISVGGQHSCANLADGTSVCWGDNSYDQLGGFAGNSNVPVPVTGLDGSTSSASAVLLTTGEINTCAVLADGSAVCWGQGFYGQLGNGSTSASATPVDVTGLNGSTPASSLPWNQGVGSTLAPPPAATGPGAPHNVMISTPTPTSLEVSWLPPFDDGGSAITDYAIEYRRIGTIAWTSIPRTVSTVTTYRKTGLDTGVAYEFRVAAVTANGTGPWNRPETTIAVGGNYSCVVRADGAVSCWGGNESGQLGDNSTTQRLAPVVVSGIDGSSSTAKAESVASAVTHSCALMATGAVKCWGGNSYGQLGDGSQFDRLTPVTVTGIDGSSNASRAVAMSVGGDQSCAIMVDGSARCWGRNDHGQLGDGTTIDGSAPVAVGDSDGSAPDSTVVSIALGDNHSCAVYEDGSARCWGANDRGQLGDGSTVEQHTPTVVSGIDGATSATSGSQIAAGGSNSCVTFVNGSLSCWGANSSGQIGDGTYIDRDVPTAVLGFDGSAASSYVAVVDVASSFACASLVDGRGKCWGANSYGQVGSPDGYGSFSTPVVISLWAYSEFGVSAISGGGASSCAIRANGSAVCWGNNGNGQLGNGNPNLWGAGSLNVSGISGAGGSASGLNGRGMGFTPFSTPGRPRHVVAQGGASSTDEIEVTWEPPLSNGGKQVTGYEVQIRQVGETVWGTIESGTNQLSTEFFSENPATTYEFRVGAINDVSNSPGVWSGHEATLATGGGHTCAVETDGSAVCWGDNSSGQLGDGTLLTKNTPVPVNGLDGSTPAKTVVSITDGDSHTCVALLDGSAACWGDNASGQLGNNSLVDSSVPVAVLDLDGSSLAKSVVSIFAGGLSTCAVLGDGSTKCWGANASGQLGVGNTTDSTTPVAVIGLDGVTPASTAVELSISGQFACAALRDGSAKCWGLNSMGQLGNGLNTDSSSPVSVSGLEGSTPNSTVVAVEVGDLHACAILESGSVKCWGNNYYGKLGNGSATEGPVSRDSSTPVAVSGLDGSSAATAAVSLSLGGAFSCALLADGTAKCWGAGWFGQIGSGSTLMTNSVPVPVLGFDGSVPSKRWVAISAGSNHACAISADELVWCWGSNSSGQIGDGESSNALLPVAASGITPGSISAAEYGTNGMGNPGLVRGVSTSNATQTSIDLTWSAPSENGGAPIVNYQVRFQEVGTSNWQTYSHPTSANTSLTVTGLTKNTSYAFQVAAVNDAGNVGPWVGVFLMPTVGGSHSCAIAVTKLGEWDTATQCWGSGEFGALGNGALGDNLVPGYVSGIDGVDDNWASDYSVSAGHGFNCVGVGEDGVVKCWGLNSSGQLGDGTTTNRSAPVGVLEPDGATLLQDSESLTTGAAHGCVIRGDDGAVLCWGSNSHGQLGNGTTTNSMKASLVSGLGLWPQGVAAGANFTCAIEGDLTVKCWGANDHGQLGDGTTLDRNTPVQVVGIDGLTSDTSASLIFAGGSTVCVQMQSAAVLCWGANDHGQLGDGTTIDRRTPGPVSNIGSSVNLTVSQLSVGVSSACAITQEDGAIRCWGANDQGQLGDGTTVDRLTPVIVDFDFDSAMGIGATSVSVGGKSACATVAYDYMQPTMSVSAYCWGDNAHGQLGDGTTQDRLTMTRVLQGVIGKTLDSSSSGPTVPDAPTDIAVKRRSMETIDIEWSLPAYQGGAAVTGYEITWVRMGYSPRPADSATVSRQQTKLKVTGLVPGARYTFSVKAVNRIGTGAPATVTGIVPVRAKAPKVTNEVWKNRVITLSWQSVKTPSHSPVLGYALSCQVDGGAIFRTKLGPSARTGSVTVDSDKLYSCRVAAMTDAGRGLGSIRVTVGPQKGQGNGR